MGSGRVLGRVDATTPRLGRGSVLVVEAELRYNFYMGRQRNFCSVDECGNFTSSSGFCNKHFWRFTKYGDPLHPVRAKEPQIGNCSVENCANPARSRGMCSKHLWRLKQHGDVHHNERPQYGTSDITYSGAHLRVRSQRGSARNHRCVACGSGASQWAYDHNDPNEKFDANQSLRYSADPNHYTPMCAPCHTHFDKGSLVLL